MGRGSHLHGDGGCRAAGGACPCGHRGMRANKAQSGLKPRAPCLGPWAPRRGGATGRLRSNQPIKPPPPPPPPPPPHPPSSREAGAADARKGDMVHKYPQNQSYVGSTGQTLTTNVSMTLCNWRICHQTHVLCGRTTFGTELN